MAGVRGLRQGRVLGRTQGRETGAARLWMVLARWPMARVVVGGPGDWGFGGFWVFGQCVLFRMAGAGLCNVWLTTGPYASFFGTFQKKKKTQYT